MASDGESEIWACLSLWGAQFGVCKGKPRGTTQIGVSK